MKRQAAYLGAFVLLKWIDLLLKRFGYAGTSRILMRTSPAPKPNIDDYTRARLLAIAVDSAAAHRVVDVTCLRRSLALWWLMRWRRMPAEVRLAFRLKEGRADGHAWVQHHGQVINDLPTVAEHYPILYDATLSPEQMSQL